MSTFNILAWLEHSTLLYLHNVEFEIIIRHDYFISSVFDIAVFSLSGLPGGRGTADR